MKRIYSRYHCKKINLLGLKCCKDNLLTSNHNAPILNKIIRRARIMGQWVTCLPYKQPTWFNTGLSI